MVKKSLISRNKSIMGGRPCVRGTRVTTSVIKSFYRGNETIHIIALAYQLTQKQVKAAVNFKNKVKI